MSQHKKHVGAWLHSRGVTFRVWAPFADAVTTLISVSFDQNEHPMESEGDGYWSVQVRKAKAGQEYKFKMINGDQEIIKNDPRALQLTATNGTSIIVDRTFDWGRDDDFEMPAPEDQIVYEMHIGSFARKDASTEGTFYDAIEKLDHLEKLGINIIELMPVGNMYNDRGWGYAPEYIYSVEGAYGGRHGLLEFVKAAHERGIGVILDVVYNHFYPGDNNALHRFDGWHDGDGDGIYFYNDWRGKTPWGPRPDFGRFEVRQYLLDNVRYWLQDCHLNGIRVDSTLFMRNAKGSYDEPGADIPEAWQFMQEMNKLAKKIQPNSLMIAEESGQVADLTMPVDVGGAGFDSQWECAAPYAFRKAILDENPDMGLLVELLPQTYNNQHLQRILYVDSHDSAANGAARLNSQIDPRNPQSPKALSGLYLAAAITMTAPGVPMLLQGYEFAQDGNFNDWQSLDWSLVAKHHGTFKAYSDLISLRLNNHGHSAGLKDKHINITHVDQDNKVMVYHRWSQGGAGDDVMIIANFGTTDHGEYSFNFPRDGEWIMRFNSTWSKYYDSDSQGSPPQSGSISVNESIGTTELPAHSICILSQEP